MNHHLRGSATDSANTSGTRFRPGHALRRARKWCGTWSWLLCLALLCGAWGAGPAVADEVAEDDPADTEWTDSEIAETDDTSTESPEQFRVVVENRTAFPIQIIEYDESGDSYVPRYDLAAGEALDDRVVAGEVWIFSVGGEALVGQYATTDEPDQWVILDDAALAAANYPPGALDDSWQAFGESTIDLPVPEALPTSDQPPPD